MAETTTRYALTRTVALPFEEADRRIREELQKQGFGVLTEIDVKATLKKKLDVDVPRHLILGACAPPFAYRAIQAEPSIGLLLPCNVVVRDAGEEGRTVVEAIDPVVQMEVTGRPDLEAIAGEVRARLTSALDGLDG